MAIRTYSLRRIAVVAEYANYYLAQSFAYLEDGGVCRVYVIGNPPEAVSWTNGSYTLPATPETINSERRYSFPAEFRCDQPVRVGEKARVQVLIAAGSGDFSNDRYRRYEEARLIHFGWPEVEIGQ